MFKSCCYGNNSGSSNASSSTGGSQRNERVARAIFLKGNLCRQWYDIIGVLSADGLRTRMTPVNLSGTYCLLTCQSILFFGVKKVSIQQYDSAESDKRLHKERDTGGRKKTFDKAGNDQGRNRNHN